MAERSVKGWVYTNYLCNLKKIKHTARSILRTKKVKVFNTIMRDILLSN